MLWTSSFAVLSYVFSSLFPARPLSSLAFVIIGMTLSLTSLSSIFIYPPSVSVDRPWLLPALLLFPARALLKSLPLNIFLALLEQWITFNFHLLFQFQAAKLSLLYFLSLTAKISSVQCGCRCLASDSCLCVRLGTFFRFFMLQECLENCV